MADKAASENMHRPQTDPRLAVGTDVLMGRHRFSSPDMQATWDPLILEQCQKIGLAAMLKTIEAVAPKQRYASEGIRMPRAKVFIRDLATNKWEGLHDLIVWGRGYACVSTDTGVRWLPARCVRPDLRRPRQNVTNAQPSNTDQHADQQSDGPSTSRSRK
ncbi:hypothetical protein Nmel_000543 [Mimus melanotis]